MQDLFKRHPVPQRTGARVGVAPRQADTTARQLLFAQEQQRSRQGIGVHRHARRGRTGLHQLAHATDDVRRAAGLAGAGEQGLTHRGALLLIIQQTFGGTHLREDGGQRLVQLMGNSRGHFTQGAQPRHGRQADLFLLASCLGARPLPGGATGRQQAAGGRPGQPFRPGPVGERQPAPTVQGKGLADRTQRFAQVDGPAR
ncbi:hypothetical protein D9M68_697630 [compost metagenome]